MKKNEIFVIKLIKNQFTLGDRFTIYSTTTWINFTNKNHRALIQINAF